MLTRWVSSGVGAVIGIGAAHLIQGQVAVNAEQHVTPTSADEAKLKAARRDSLRLVTRRKEECGAPGISITVHKDGRPVWRAGVGYSDVENLVAMRADCVLRIASISKPLTMTAVARAVEQGVLDVNAPVQRYLPTFPAKRVDGQLVEITVEQLIRHRGGIRHYETREQLEAQRLRREETERRRRERREQGESGRQVVEQPDESEFQLKEYRLRDKYDSVLDALQLFQHDQLVNKPGTSYHYSTHGWTLVSAVLEAATGTKFEVLMTRLFADLGLRDTCLDQNEPIVQRRGSYYVREKGGRLRNARLVDNSYKWAGGGLLSTSDDLCRFGDVMLFSWQNASAAPALLRRETVRWLWRPDADEDWRRGCARGWFVTPPLSDYGAQRQEAFTLGTMHHTGGAIGCSSVLVLLPAAEQVEPSIDGRAPLPRGVTVAVIANIENVGLRQLATRVAERFADV